MKEIALMLDMGRKHYSKKWILQLVDYMNELGMNTLQLHFSENEGFRIESDLYPEIVSSEYHRKVDIQQIISYANDHGIQIIPDFDTPGHLKQVLQFYPEFQLEVVDKKTGKSGKDSRSLDISKPEARAFIKRIYKEYAELFAGSEYFHIGADEFIIFDDVQNYPELVAYGKAHYGEEATGIETYVEYTNEIIDYVIQLGFTPRIWNDGFYRINQDSLVKLDTRAEVTYWTKWHQNMAEVSTFIEKGHQLINFNDNYFYYVLGENASYLYPTARKIDDEWRVNMFSSHQMVTAEQMDTVIGTSFAIWCDIPHAQTEDEVFTGIKEPLRAMVNRINEYKNKGAEIYE